ncbi:MAG: hypothetical protein WEA09_12100 [Gemmatimonadota bacterium]
MTGGRLKAPLVRRLLALGLFPFLLHACAPTYRVPAGEASFLQASVPVRVENDHANAVLISAEARNVRLRLGVVGPGERASLVLPGGRMPAGAVRFRVQGEGSLTSYLSPPLQVRDDSMIHVQAAPNLDRSRVWLE